MTFSVVLVFTGFAFTLLGIITTAAQGNFIATSWAVVALVLWLGTIVKDLV